ncbi:MAG: TfoX/Sxy family DNA transformation protein [Chloroflexi bacterium]|nr:TfoX/Sxy family DNA transformation protein [Chloroflexota bacterium]
MDDRLNQLQSLKNIGAVSAEKLLGVGISSREQIEELGAVTVFQRLRERYPVSMNMLWALQGALLDLPYYLIPKEIKDALLEELSNDENSGDRQF